MYKQQRNYENVNKRLFDGTGVYQIPQIQPTHFDFCEFIGFNYARSEKYKKDKGVHFFLDDYQFSRVWTNIDKYVPMLGEFKYVMAPDFSLFTDFPKALQIYNHYRKHWVAAYLQEAGVQVIPTIAWSTKDSFEWCFDGESIGGCVAVSSVGCMNSAENKTLFLAGYREMMNRLMPETIIFYGDVPVECEGNIVRIGKYSDRFTKEHEDGR